jgi:hypothetical protein
MSTKNNTEDTNKSETDTKKTVEPMNDTSNATPTNPFEQIFTKSNIIIMLWFLGIYIVISFIMRLSTTNYNVPNDRTVIITRMLDFIVLIMIVITLILSYFYKTEKEKEKIVENAYNTLVDSIDNPVTIVTVVVFICILYMLVMILGIPMDHNKPITIGLMENLAWVSLAVLLIAAFFKYVLKISISEFLNKMFNDIWGDKPKEEPVAKKPVPTEEVFNIANNAYTYADAQSVCKSFNSRLATYDEIENTYNKGGEWCNYGWSDNQSIYFPTQKATWEKLQKTQSHKNDCGRPGVNGGFIANPNVRFGVNCFGKKPKPTDKELEYMKTASSTYIHKNPEEKVANLKVEFFKKHRDEFLRLNAFNKDKWSEV